MLRPAGGGGGALWCSAAPVLVRQRSAGAPVTPGRSGAPDDGVALSGVPDDGVVALTGVPDDRVPSTWRTRMVARVVRGRVVAGSDAGMATAEYAIATVAAVGFAGLLMVVLRSGEVQALLLGLIRGALSV